MLYGWKGSSGGYLEYVLRATAKQLYGLDVHEIEYKQGRNSDVKVATIEVSNRYYFCLYVQSLFKRLFK